MLPTLLAQLLTEIRNISQKARVVALLQQDLPWRPFTLIISLSRSTTLVFGSDQRLWMYRL